MASDNTMFYDFGQKRDKSIEETLAIVYQALEAKGYNPTNQIVGYLMSGDPAYIPRLNDARNLIRQFQRDEIVEALVNHYLKETEAGK